MHMSLNDANCIVNITEYYRISMNMEVYLGLAAELTTPCISPAGRNCALTLSK
mgnify:CR=1 FL=1